MKASELIEILKHQIEMVGDKPIMINGRYTATDIKSASLAIVDDNNIAYTNVLPDTIEFDCILLDTEKDLW